MSSEFSAWKALKKSQANSHSINYGYCQLYKNYLKVFITEILSHTPLSIKWFGV